MSPLYAYSLTPVVGVSLLLLFTLLLRRSAQRAGLAAYCGSIAIWSISLMFLYVPPLAAVGQRLAACGAFVVSSFLHAAYDFTGQESYALVWFAYSVAAILTLGGVAFPGMLYDPLSLTAGPLFWPGMALAVSAATVPLITLAHAARNAGPDRRSTLHLLLLAGGVCYGGAWANALMLSHGYALPYGMLFVLGSLFLLARLVSLDQIAHDRKILDRSLLYSALAALVSSGFLFGAFTVLSDNVDPFLSQYRLGAFLMLFMAAVAFEPLRQHALEALGGRILAERANASELARELIAAQERQDQDARLAELGALTSAIAHEVRNPLGVLRAQLKLLERQGADANTIGAMREQIARAATFADDLVRYGRPRPLELRDVSPHDLVSLAISTATQARHDLAAVDVSSHCPDDLAPIEVDQSQLLQVLVLLIDNAILALQSREHRTVHVGAQDLGDAVLFTVEDDGPGLPPELADTIFEPFVTGRKRDGKLAGTGLGLAIARRVVDRHGGGISHATSDTLGGARFIVRIPRTHSLVTPTTVEPS